MGAAQPRSHHPRARGIPAVDEHGNPTPAIETRTTEKLDVHGNVIERTVIAKRGLVGNTADAKWLLERRMPQEYGRVWRAEISAPKGKPIEVSLDEQIAELTEEAFAIRLQIDQSLPWQQARGTG